MSEWLTRGRRLGFLNARKIDHGCSGFVKLQNGNTEIDTRNDLNGIDLMLWTWLFDHTKVWFWNLQIVIVMRRENFHAGDLLGITHAESCKKHSFSSRICFQLTSYFKTISEHQPECFRGFSICFKECGTYSAKAIAHFSSSAHICFTRYSEILNLMNWKPWKFLGPVALKIFTQRMLIWIIWNELSGSFI